MDGFRVEPITGQSVVVNTGERIDMLITADKPPGNYWIRIETLEYTTKSGVTFC